MGKIIEVLNLEKGLQTIEMPYTQDQEDKAIEKLKFSVDGVEFAGWCRECNKPVQRGTEKYDVTMSNGVCVADCFHIRCDR